MTHQGDHVRRRGRGFTSILIVCVKDDLFFLISQSRIGDLRVPLGPRHRYPHGDSWILLLRGVIRPTAQQAGLRDKQRGSK